jgi:hypothetical protein
VKMRRQQASPIVKQNKLMNEMNLYFVRLRKAIFK